MSNASAAIAACEKTAKDIQDTVDRNKQRDVEIARQKAEKQQVLDNFKSELNNFRSEPSRSRGDYPRLQTGCINDANIGRRDNEARNRCRNKTEHGGGYDYDGNHWSCGGWNACCEFNHHCSKTDDWLNRNWQQWRDEKDNLQKRIHEKQQEIDNLKSEYEPVPSFQCCPNITQVIGSDIQESNINQMNQCIADITKQLQSPVDPKNNVPSNNNEPLSDNVPLTSSIPAPTNNALSTVSGFNKNVIIAIIVGVVLLLFLSISLSFALI